MIHFFRSSSSSIIAVAHPGSLSPSDRDRLCWLFGQAAYLDQPSCQGTFLGPRKEMVTPWSTNAVEITQNMGINGIERIEEFFPVADASPLYDRMLQSLYQGLDEEIFHIEHLPDPLVWVEDIATYNQQEGLALSEDEIEYLEALSKQLNRKLSDSEVFGFSQVNSEHCRHKIFNGLFILDGEEMPQTLFQLIKKTSSLHPGRLVSAYTDNVAFIEGPPVLQFAPENQETSSWFTLRPIQGVISLKAETHNFPTTVEPFNGAATGGGGEIRDRMAGGRGSLPLAGTAVYMTSYPRLENNRPWENLPPRPWLYQTPEEILIKASNGASDFGNKFGQPLICGSVLTFEQQNGGRTYGFDKVIMLAGGIGYARHEDSLKNIPEPGDKIIVLGGDNYRIGMGGGAVSSVATGEYGNQIELNAVQRSNPEMQKRVYNAIRAMAESNINPVVSIHDHGAGGHLNSLSELVEHSGGTIHIDSLPVGDPTLSDREIIGNESQERMGLIMKPADAQTLQKVCERERAPYYEVGMVGDDHRLVFKNRKTGEAPIDLHLEHLFGKPPRTVLTDHRVTYDTSPLTIPAGQLLSLVEAVLSLEAAACKDWLTNKVDRSVSGRIAMQQTAGPVQLPLNNLGIATTDYQGTFGIATSLGHAPIPGLLHPEAASRLSVAEALTNIIWAPIQGGLKGISLSANWMWPCKQEGEDERLYRAVKALSDFCIALHINVPTGKDSLSMTQKYPGGNQVISPGTVIVTAVGEVTDIKKAISPVLKPLTGTTLLYIDVSGCDFELGGSSLAQVLGEQGDTVPDITDISLLVNGFAAIQAMLKEDIILSGHDVSAGGLITTLLEMAFAETSVGMDLDLSAIDADGPVSLLFSEKPALVIQVEDLEAATALLTQYGVSWKLIGEVTLERTLTLQYRTKKYTFEIDTFRDTWFRTSYLLDRKQCGEEKALARMENYKQQPLRFRFPEGFDGKMEKEGCGRLRPSSPPKAAIIREKGVNGDREMAYSLYYAGFDVKDVHMTDLITGRETLDDIRMIVFVGGFSNSDVLGSAKGWAGAFLYNDMARQALDRFYARKDTLSLGVCNGCQLMVELGLLYPGHSHPPVMALNASHKFESQFLTVEIPENDSVMLSSLSGSRLGVWVAHGEGRFLLPAEKENYHFGAFYAYADYPGNPNGSDYAAAALASEDGRHLAMMPHLERSLFPWQWAYYQPDRKDDIASPWLEAFVNARHWVEEHPRKTS